MDRRAFIARVTASIFVGPLAGLAQRPQKVRIGYLSGNPPSDTQEAIDAFQKRLRELGSSEGRDLLIEHRYAEGMYDRLPELAADLVRLKVDILLTYGTPATLVAKKATSKIPIVFAAVADPIVAGIVPTLTRPGGNATGVTTSNPELSAKRLSLFKEAVPRVSRLVVLGNPAFPPYSDMLAETQVAAGSLGVEIQVLEVRTRSELETASKGIGEKKAHGLVILPDPMFISQRRRVVELVARSRLPAMYHLRQFVEVGGLMSYGVSYSESFLQSAALVDKILRGAKPANVPVEQPWHFELIINMKTAKALGLTIPPSVLARADETIH